MLRGKRRMLVIKCYDCGEFGLSLMALEGGTVATLKILNNDTNSNIKKSIYSI